MTCQSPEAIEYEGKQLPLYSEPLMPRLPPSGRGGMNIGKLDDDYPFEVSCTANWRGYVASWKIEADRLYLVGISGRLLKGVEASISDLFPGTSGPVLANWFSGELSIECGNVIGHIDGFYMRVYEESVILTVKAGIVVGKRIQRNKVPVEVPEEESDDSEGEIGR